MIEPVQLRAESNIQHNGKRLVRGELFMTDAAEAADLVALKLATVVTKVEQPEEEQLQQPESEPAPTTSATARRRAPYQRRDHRAEE